MVKRSQKLILIEDMIFALKELIIWNKKQKTNIKKITMWHTSYINDDLAQSIWLRDVKVKEEVT